METISTVRRILGKDLKETGVASVFTLVVPFLPWNAKRIEANKREQALRQTKDTGADLGIIAGPDDREWLICIAPDS